MFGASGGLKDVTRVDVRAGTCTASRRPGSRRPVKSFCHEGTAWTFRTNMTRSSKSAAQAAI